MMIKGNHSALYYGALLLASMLWSVNGHAGGSCGGKKSCEGKESAAWSHHERRPASILTTEDLIRPELKDPAWVHDKKFESKAFAQKPKRRDDYAKPGYGLWMVNNPYAVNPPTTPLKRHAYLYSQP